jgi:PAS domain S-box-containing protein
LAVLSPILSKLTRDHETLFFDEVLTTRGESTYALAHEFDRLGVDVVVPLLTETYGVTGLVAIGRKRSGDPYFSDDADLLATLANQAAVAIRNAQTHQRVVQMNEELQKILSTIESGVVAVGIKGKVTLFNRAAEQLIGQPAAGVRGQHVGELPAPLSPLLLATLTDGQPRPQVEFSHPDAAGQVVPLVCSTSPLLSPQGEAIGAVAVIGDLSRLKELEHERRRAERLASFEAMAAGLVHEIRNPLVAIKAFSQLLPTRYQDPEYREAFSRVAGQEVRRIDDLLTRFRTLASASSQPMEPVHVLEPLRQALELLRPQLEAQQVRVREVADGRPRPVLGNSSQLAQLFINLCLNAVEAMGPDGELTLRVADLSDGGGTTLLVEVSDTGTGIAEELLPKIFDPFVTTKERGSGLGLAICRGIADAHRCRLTARNNVGRPGATFTIEFPVLIGHMAPARV